MRTALTGLLVVGSGCGGGAFVPPPVALSVSLSSTTIVVPPNGSTVSVPVTITAPTETASFNLSGLPGGVTYNYKESESNPSGLLTLMATSLTKPGSYPATITVGSSGQTASLVFTLVVSMAAKPASLPFTCCAKEHFFQELSSAATQAGEKVVLLKETGFSPSKKDANTSGFSH